MPHFFAEFRKTESCWIRHNTRIYLSEFNGDPTDGQCLGAIVAKNPGAAKSAGDGWGPLRLAGDKMLPTVRNILLAAFARTGKSPPQNAYFQVLNLFYICGQDLKQATKTLENETEDYRDPAESGSFPLIWFAWGGDFHILNPLKDRFSAMKSDHAFYYSPAAKSVVTGIPPQSVLAKHPQSMPQEPVIAHLAGHL